MARFWTEEVCDTCIEILVKEESLAAALKKISKKLKKPITKDAIGNGFRSCGFESPGVYLGSELESDEWEQVEEETSAMGPDVQALLKALAKKTHTLETLCNEVFDASPKKVLKIVEKAQKNGLDIQIAHGAIAFKTPEEKQDVAVSVELPTEHHHVAVISDIHFGSIYHLGPFLRDFIQRAYEMGIRDILCPGDLLEGCYKHAQFELSHVGWHSQAEAALEGLPELPGLKYYFIDGNHDFTFFDKIGMESGKALVDMAKARGRNDLVFLGSRGATINYGGTKIRLWHPKAGAGYALSYQLQNYIKKLDPRIMPDIVLAGHWHTSVYFTQQNVHALACGTFQGGQSPFGKSLGGDPAICGHILEWRKVKNQQGIRDFSVHKLSYFEDESPLSVTPSLELG